MTVSNPPRGGGGGTGADGASAYDLWLAAGNTGDVNAFLASLDGPTGPTGPTGPVGQDGQTPYIGGNGNWFVGGADTGVAAQGPPGSGGSGGGNITAGTRPDQIPKWDVATTAYKPSPAALLRPRLQRSPDRRLADKWDTCDSTTGVTGTAGKFVLDPPANTIGGAAVAPIQAGTGANGMLRLDGGSGPNVTTTMQRALPNGPWSFGDGDNDTAYLRFFIAVDDARDAARSCILSSDLDLASDPSFNNYVSIKNVAQAVFTEAPRPKDRNKVTCMHQYMATVDVGAGMGALVVVGTPNLGALTHWRLTLRSKNPGDASAYVMPKVWLGGIQRVPQAPFAIMSWQWDHQDKQQVPINQEMFWRYGIRPMCNIEDMATFTGGQGSTVLSLAQLHDHYERGFVDFGVYINQQTTGVAGQNNFGGGDGVTVPGVPYSQISKAQLQQNFEQAHYYMDLEGFPGAETMTGQERKMRDDSTGDGDALLRRYASNSRVPSTVALHQSWPADEPMRLCSWITGMSDLVDQGGGVYTVSPTMQARIRRAFKSKEWLHITAHNTQPGPPGAGIPYAGIRAILDYAQTVGFGGSGGKFMSFYEALNLTRDAA